MPNQPLAKSLQLRENIVAAAQKLFQHYGFQKTTMEDIARHLGIGKSTLYYYFKSKEEVFEAVVVQEIKDVMTETKKAVEKVDTAEAKIQAYAFTTLHMAKNKINLYRVIRDEFKESRVDYIHRLAKDFGKNEVCTLRDILLQGFREKEFTELLNEENMDFIAFTLVSAQRSLYFDLFFEDEYFSKFDRLEVMLKILLNGLKR